MAPENPIYSRWTPPVETHLPDIHGWLDDIHSAQDFARRLSHELDAENPDLLLVDALTTAALVRYSRCFTTGIRIPLSIDALSTALPTDIELHGRLRGIRDWYIAHPVNKQEVHTLYVIFDGSPGATTGVIGFSSRTSAQGALQQAEADAMSELCEKWINYLKSQMTQEEMRLVEHANRLSRTELLSLPQDEPQPNSNIKAKRRQVPRR
jgi:hypothetical protein